MLSCVNWEVLVIKELITHAGAKSVMSQYGLMPKKKLGQHFLVDSFVLEKILNAADAGEGDLILEIGPGIGALTQGLLGRVGDGGHIVAVELDKQLVPILEELFSGKNITVVQGDILRIDLAQLKFPPSPKRVKVVANLPYYITTPVILYLLESGLPIESITVMIQKEVAMRMAAAPGTKDYGSLSLAVQYYAQVSVAANVPVNSFVPRPAVDSAVAHLKILESSPLPFDIEKERLFKVIHAAFGQRRKTLVNALDSAGFGKGKDTLQAALESCGLSPQVRGEKLNLLQFAQLTNALEQIQ